MLLSPERILVLQADATPGIQALLAERSTLLMRLDLATRDLHNLRQRISDLAQSACYAQFPAPQPLQVDHARQPLG